eukprot:TRINITY_DN7673_c0_g1_i1.p1 TRINITY_DN7673_c0_g1~~TRINITY_DN7673_c0_g1_i1.p1  ORF type:complete len:265 (+),score=87.88 TRINITY_DN7673_c0_g1_i1:64-795(+)
MSTASFFTSPISTTALSSFADITPAVQSHLQRVYATLALTVAFAAAGSYAHLMYNIGGLLTALTGVALIFAIAATRDANRKDQTDRIGLLSAFGFVQGASIGPLIALVLGMNGGQEIIMTAFASTVVIFGCFSAAALTSTRRSYLYLSGAISSGLSTLLVLGLMNLWFRSPLVDSVRLYLGLIVFVGFILFDTQLIVEKASLGDRDFVSHSLTLFLDAINLFVKLLRLMAKKKKDDKKSNSRR